MKYFSAEISEAYKAVEAASCQSLLDLLPTDLREDYAPYLLPAGAYTRYLPYLCLLYTSVAAIFFHSVMVVAAPKVNRLI